MKKINSYSKAAWATIKDVAIGLLFFIASLVLTTSVYQAICYTFALYFRYYILLSIIGFLTLFFGVVYYRAQKMKDKS